MEKDKEKSDGHLTPLSSQRMHLLGLVAFYGLLISSKSLHINFTVSHYYANVLSSKEPKNSKLIWMSIK